MSEAELKLIMMNEVQEQAVEWLWHPYIPFGKITVVQGDPGDGKTTFVLALTALITIGRRMPESNTDTVPSVVIYQTAEDGLADTIKPRLTALGAACSRVVVIDESEKDLTLIDERIEQAIRETKAKLFIIDPLQAYLGVNVDMHRANEIRPVFKSLAGVAERTGCAIMILGHMNKMSGAVKGLYRGLGSIDIAAAARSILLIGRVKDSPTMRVMAHLKSSLAQEGQSIAFDIGGDTGRFAWIGESINGSLKAIGYALLVLFFLVGVVKTCGSFTEIKRPEHALKLFVRFAIAKGVVSYGLDLMMALFRIVQGIITTAMNTAGIGAQGTVTMPAEMEAAVRELTFLQSIPAWAVSLLGSLVIIVLSFIMIMSVYGRFFKLYLYTAIAPIPLSAFAGEPSASIGKSFLKSYAAVCLEGAIIVLACVIFSVFASSPPVVSADASPVTMVWSYMGELIFNLLVLTGAVKMADRVVREMFGL